MFLNIIRFVKRMPKIQKRMNKLKMKQSPPSLNMNTKKVFWIKSILSIHSNTSEGNI